MIAPYVNASDGFIQFLSKLLQHDPSKRYASARAAAEALEKIRPTSERSQEKTQRHFGEGPDPTGRLRKAAVLTAPPRGAGSSREGIPTLVLSSAAAGFRWLISKRGLTASSYGAQAWGIDLGKQILGLRPGHEYVIGRGDEADVMIPLEWPRSSSVSRLHASLTPQPTGLHVKGLGSANGTSLGLLRIDGESPGVTISQATELRVGAVEIRIAPLGPAKP